MKCVQETSVQQSCRNGLQKVTVYLSNGNKVKDKQEKKEIARKTHYNWERKPSSNRPFLDHLSKSYYPGEPGDYVK